MRKVILTGSDGFIGKSFKKTLSKTWDVVEVEKHNCWSFLLTFKDWSQVDFICHQGANSSTVDKDLFDIWKTNTEFSLNLFQLAIEHQIPVKYASSASVYGRTNDTMNPLNYYAISKLTIDYWVQDHIKECKHVQGFRYFNVYGDGEDEKIIRDQSSPISKFIYQAQTDGVIRVFENSKTFFRDFVCVDDLLNIMLDNTRESGIYDLGTSNPISFLAVANIVAKYYNAHVEYIPFPKHLEGKYQTYTKAKPEWGTYHFKTVEDYVKDSVD